MEDNVNSCECCDVFKAAALKELLPYQVDHLRREFGNFIALNEVSHSYCFNTYPKCEAHVDHFKNGGYTYIKAEDGSNVRGKTLLKCP